MSLYIDVTYLRQLSPRLPLFKQKGEYLWNCRCILCGDSSTKKTKTRGYFYRTRQDLFYKCHNCNASMHFGTFLKGVDPALYDEYYFERFLKGEGGRKAHVAKAEDLFRDEEPMRELVVPPKDWEDDVLSGVCQKVSDLPEDHVARVYCAGRMIPSDQLYRLYYLPQTKDILSVAPEKYKDALNTTEPRLAIPFHKENGKIVGVTLRALGESSRRYINVVFEEDALLIFGLLHLDKTQPITVLEGQFDSLFVPNSIACGGTSFGKIESFGLPKEQLTIVFDNQPRNADVCKIMKKYIDKGFRVCVWPEEIEEKDVNEMVVAGRDPVQIIRDNTYQGIEAELQFSMWRKIQ
jgi:hypothetical protein